MTAYTLDVSSAKTSSPPVLVAILSDDGLFGEGLLRLISAESGVAIAQTSDDPEILLADSRLNGELNSVLKMCAGFRRDGGPYVIFVAAPDDDQWAAEALAAGARGILPKSARPADLLEAVRVVRDGLIWAPRRVMALALERFIRDVPAGGGSSMERRLSVREREVFRHAATGLCNKELAERLEISEATVKVHMTRIFQKLGVQSRAELAAAYHGLLPASTERRGIRLLD